MYWTNTSFQQLTLASPRFSITKCKYLLERKDLKWRQKISNCSENLIYTVVQLSDVRNNNFNSVADVEITFLLGFFYFV